MRFVDFWKGFDPEDHWLCESLSKGEGTCYSVFGDEYKNANVGSGPLVFFSAENFWEQEDRFRRCTHSFSHHYPGDGELGHVIGERHTRILNFVAKLGPENVREQIENRLSVKPERLRRQIDMRDGICSMVNRRKVARRIELFEALDEGLGDSGEPAVAAAGKLRNNMAGGWKVPWGWESLKSFQSLYTFALVTENIRKPGYTTEKLFNALLAGTIPVYWGDPDVERHFNLEAFVDRRQFASDQDMIEHLRAVQADPDLQMQYLAAPMVLDEHMEKGGVYCVDRYRAAVENAINPL